jgi:hypothetical protein
LAEPRILDLNPEMRLAVMQPYFLPYIGYFQLMAAVDKFVVLDDVNYIVRGWVNRNRIATGHGTRWMTLPVAGASQNRLIDELDIAPDTGWKQGLLAVVGSAYRPAPFAETAIPQFAAWIAAAEGNLSAFLTRILLDVKNLLAIDAQVVPSSSVYPKNGLTGADRILEICRRENATTYINLPGGRSLYDREAFAAAGVELKFIDLAIPPGSVRHGGDEGPVLSILDLLMHNDAAALADAARQYVLA